MSLRTMITFFEDDIDKIVIFIFGNKYLQSYIFIAPYFM